MSDRTDTDLNNLLAFLCQANPEQGHRTEFLRDEDMPIEMRRVTVPGAFEALFEESGKLIQLAPHESSQSA